MMNDLGLDDQQQQYCFRKIISIAIRTTYYIFCNDDDNESDDNTKEQWPNYLPEHNTANKSDVIEWGKRYSFKRRQL